MSNYTKSTNFAIKDSLVTTDPAKIIKGTDIDNEYNAISNAIASKADVNSPALTGTPTAPTATAGSNTTQIATTAFATAAALAVFPSGGIILWSGAISAIPSGWVLCNGSNSTPDLRNRFVVGAGSTYAVAATGGSADATLVSHSHGVNDPGHGHGVSDPGHSHSSPSNGAPNGGGAGAAFTTGMGNVPGHATTSSGTGISIQGSGTGISIQANGSSATNANLPPYYALAYIMKS